MTTTFSVLGHGKNTEQLRLRKFKGLFRKLTPKLVINFGTGKNGKQKGT